MEKRFSERIGIVKVDEVLAINKTNNQLRTHLWNFWFDFFWESLSYGATTKVQSKADFSIEYWKNFAGFPVDEIPTRRGFVLDYEVDYLKVLRLMKSDFFDNEWYKVYDLLEFTNSMYKAPEEKFATGCNLVLKKWGSGYRFINGYLVPITSENEIQEIENSLVNTVRSNSIFQHLEKSIRFLSDKEKPDYENSIKESISAIEALLRVITRKDKATLNDALLELEKKGKIHSQLKLSYSALYNYSSDKGGVRHANKENDTESTFSEAKYILVISSAFINLMLPLYLEQTNYTLEQKTF